MRYSLLFVLGLAACGVPQNIEPQNKLQTIEKNHIEGSMRTYTLPDGTYCVRTNDGLACDFSRRTR